MAKVKIFIEKDQENITIESNNEKINNTINTVVNALIENNLQPSIVYGMVIGVLTAGFEVKKVKNFDEELKITIKAPADIVIDVLESYVIEIIGINISRTKNINEEDEY